MKNTDSFKEMWAVISDKSEYPQDSIGNTRLTLLADKIKLLSPASRERLSYAVAIREFVKILDKLSLRSVRNLCKLLALAEFSPYEYANAFMEDWNTVPRSIPKRAEIFRLIGESGIDVDRFFVLKEDKIKRRYPWYWIDVAARIDTRLAVGATRECLKSADASPILQRLPSWLELCGNKKALRRLLADVFQGFELTDIDKETIELFFKSS